MAAELQQNLVISPLPQSKVEVVSFTQSSVIHEIKKEKEDKSQLKINDDTITQALLYGSIQSFNLNSINGIITKLADLVEKKEYQKYPGWQYRLLHNYCMAINGLDDKEAIDAHYCKDNICHVIYRLYLALDSSLDPEAIFRQTKLIDIIIVTYLKSFKKIQSAIMCDTYYNSDRDKGTLTKILFDRIPSIIGNSPRIIINTMVLRVIMDEPNSLLLEDDLDDKELDGKQLDNSGCIRTTIIRCALHVDNFTYLHSRVYDDKADGIIIKRIKHLATEAKLYWKEVRASYVKILKRIDLNFETMQQLIDIDDTLIEIPKGITITEFKLFNKLAWKVWNLQSDLRAYVLGLPIHMGIPGIKTIKDCVLKLAKHGIEAYSSEMGKLGNSIVYPPYQSIVHHNGGGDDLVGVPFESYGPFDRLAYIENDLLFEFTRSSWIELKDRNPFTKINFSHSFIAMKTCRGSMAGRMLLPPSKPIASLLNDVEEGKISKIRHIICHHLHQEPAILRYNEEKIPFLRASPYPIADDNREEVEVMVGQDQPYRPALLLPDNQGEVHIPVQNQRVGSYI